MIEVTNEMVCALNENWPTGVARGEGMRLGLAAVMAIVQRDHVVYPRPAPGQVAVREGWSRVQLHPTCVDIGADDEPPGSAWICVSGCRTAPGGAS